MRKILFAFIVVLALSFSAACFGATISYVDTEGDTQTVDTIADALSDASDVEDLVITISGAYSMADNEAEAITIDDASDFNSVTINGGTITGPENARHFVVDNPNLTFTLNGVTLQGNSTGGGGIQILTSGRVNLTDVTFRNINNIVANDPDDDDDYDEDEEPEDTTINGGAVEIRSGTVTFSGGTFNNNRATRGGAVYIASGASASFTGEPTFVNNNSVEEGGAIYSSGSLTFSGTGIFTGNVAGTNGGAVNIAGANGTFGAVNFGSTSGTPNSAINGGAISVSGGSATFTGTIFTNNSADLGGALYLTSQANIGAGTTFTSNIAQNGGAIYAAEAGTAAMTGAVVFNTNQATVNGGAISTAGSGSVTGTATPTFTGNIAGSDATITGVQDPGELSSGFGGALYLGGTGGITLGETVFNDNKAANGGALYVLSGAMTFSGAASFGPSTANAAYNGGAVYLAGGATTFNGTATFSKNTAQDNGGALLTSNDATVTFSSTPTFTSNTANNDSGNVGDGGAVWWGTALSAFPTSATFTSNKTNGGASTVSNNAGNGGALYIAGTGTFTLGSGSSSRYTFTENSAYNNGGAIYTNTANVAFNGIDITDENTAQYGNGGFVCSGGTVTVTDSSVTGQTAGDAGGAIYSVGAVDVTNSTFSGLTAKVGGAIFGESSVKISDQSEFSNNSASGSTEDYSGGGAIYANGDVTITDSSFTGNSSTTTNTIQYHGGGAVYASGDLTINDSTFTNNTHTHVNSTQDSGGGAIYALGNVILDGDTFAGNRTTRNTGGAIYSDHAATFSVNNTLFSGDISQLHGGAIYLVNCTTAAIDASTFTTNTATNNLGGALYAEALDVVINYSYFTNNYTRNGSGGAIAFNQSGGLGNNSSNFAVNNSVLSNNSATSGSGGAAYIITDNAQVSRCTFSNNQSMYQSSTTSGGALYLTLARGNTSKITTSTFAANSALGNVSQGGALYTQGNVKVESTTFTLNNRATGTNGKGGAIYAASGTFTITATIVVGNTAAIGSDIYADATVSTQGYNRVGVFGKSNINTSWTDALTNTDNDYSDNSWTTETFFGSSASLSDNAFSSTQPPYVGTELTQQVRIQTVTLTANASLALSAQAIDAIPYAYRTLFEDTDQRGVPRPLPQGGELDIGAVEVEQSGTVNPPSPDAYTIASIMMSGIPNTLKSIGQTASLVAMIRYTNGHTAYGGTDDDQEAVVWTSSSPNTVYVDQQGNITAGPQAGTATITVTPLRDRTVTAQRPVIVQYRNTEMNIAESFNSYFWGYLQDNLFEHDMSLSLADVRSSTIAAPTFQRNFKKVWDIASVSQVIDLSTSTPSFRNETGYTASNGFISDRPGVNINFQNLDVGKLFPLVYSWTFTGDELVELIGHDLSNTRTMNSSVAEDIFKGLQLEFQGTNGKWPVIGTGGVSAREAYNKALALSNADGNRGVHIDLTVYLANVKSSSTSGATDGPQFVKGTGSNTMLIVPAGLDDRAISGTLWMTQKVATSNSRGNDKPTNPGNNNPPVNTEDGGGGGGGCNSFGAGLLIAAVIFVMKRR